MIRILCGAKIRMTDDEKFKRQLKSSPKVNSNYCSAVIKFE